ncbi:EF-hand calcium-binding domain-containing protein 13 isoform X3 [Varanus komodoensis]|uniref:EF-hand calcium-binding domain-containing protein 13 isoform X3 n=1 Tax=Varanus komodoensis TaxID=61221 RepID=UPI001CF7A23B|nr:EF-hand calcium-binding domain-containing protein 13 isoform X3 [Varanus komodoensis]XP_044303117.1 EF-hand calcium-binding domain-containing protein 13 isoform X3 [Varanus komodoensis]
MHQALKFVPIDVHGNLDFGDFLCVIKETLPCNETDALQNAQEVFRKIKEDMVAIEELEPILACLGVTLSPMVIQQALECTQLSWDGKVNILTFLLTVRGATGLCTEVDDYATSQDFAAVGDLETLLRRKRSLLEGETQPGHANLFTFYDPDEGVTLAQLQKGKNKSQKSEGPRRPQTASPECHTEQKSKENQGIQWPKVRPHFGYTSQYTLFPLSSSLCFKEQDKQFVQKPNTKELSPRVDQKSAPSSVAQIRSSHEVFPQQRKKKMLTFQEKLPKRYDHEDNVHVANPKTSGSEGQQHSEDLSAQQALQDALELMQTLSEENIREKDLCSALKKLGVNLNDKEFQEVLQKADIAKDGMVNINTFMSAMGKTHLFTEFTMLKDAIQAIDKIEGDKMAVHDLPSFMRDMGLHLSDQEFQQALKQVSVDGNGKIVVKDFIKVLTNTSHFSELSVLKDTIKAVSNIQGNQVNLQDLKATLTNMGIHLYPHEYEELIQTIPTDKKGKIDIEQVTKKISKMQRFSEMQVLNNAIKAFSQFKDKKLKVLDMEACLNNIGIHLTKSELMEATKSLPVSSDGTVDPKELISAMKETRRFKNYSAVLDAILALKLIEEHKMVRSRSSKGNLNSFSLHMANQVIAQVLNSICMTETGQTKFNEFLRALTRSEQFRTSAALTDVFDILAKLENGKIGVEELQVLMKSFNFNLPSDEISDVLAFCIIDDDNTVNLKDFIRGLTHTSTFITNPEMQLTCMALNKLKGDHFDLHALNSTLNTMDLPAASELLQEVMKTAQVDSSGKVNFREFMRILTLVPELPEGIVLKDTFDAMSNIKDRHIHVDDLPGTLASVGIKLTPEELQVLQGSVTVAALHSAFSTINKICKENIKKEDLPGILEDLGIRLSPDELQTALASTSIDESGKLDGMEFLKILSHAPHFSELIALQDATKVVENIKTEKMTITQLEKALDNMGVHLPDATFNKAVKSAKTDGNGKIGFKDFLLALGKTKDFTELEALQRVISVIGTMHDRQLHMNELRAALSNMGIHLKEEEFQQVVHAIDVGADGTVNMKDFLTELSKMQCFKDSVALHSVVEAFSKIRDEKIDINELESVLGCLGITCNSEEIQKALQTIPVDENGKVHFKDFLVNLTSSEHFSEPAAVHDVYSFIDIVDDDKVEVSQLKDVLAAIGITLTKEEMKEALKNMTVDSDGKVNLKEFMKGLPKTRRFSTAVELEGAMETIHRIKQNKVKIEELDSIMQTMGLHLFPDEITEALKYVTKDADGSVNIQDFLFSLTKTRRFSQAERNRVPIKNLNAILENMGINLTEEEMQAVLKQVTVDAEGKVNLNEIMKSLGGMQQLPQPEGAQGNMVAMEDVDSLLSNMGIHLTNEQMQEALKHVTVDGNGKINFKDFMMGVRTVQLGAEGKMVEIDDLRSTLTGMGIHLTEKEMEETLKHITLDGDGRVNLKDVLENVMLQKQCFKLETAGERVDIQELDNILASAGIHLTKAELQEALKNNPVDAEGKVNLGEFMKRVRTIQPHAQIEEKVAVQDLESILASKGIFLNDKELQEALMHVEVNADGTVNLKEFAKAVQEIRGLEPAVNGTMGLDSLKGMGTDQKTPQIIVNGWTKERRIDIDSLDAVLDEMGIHLTNKQLYEALKYAPMDADGMVDLEAFKKGVNTVLTNQQNGQYPDKMLESKMLKLPKVLEKHRPVRFFSSVSPCDMIRLDTAKNLSKPQMEAFRNAYDTFNKDLDGNIDLTALETTAHNLGISLTEEEALDELLYADIDGDGKVNFTDFLNVITDSRRFIQAVAPNQGDMETVDAQGILFFELLSKLVESSMLPRKTTVNIVSYYRQKFLEATGKRAWHSDGMNAEGKGRHHRGKPRVQKAKSTSMSAFAGAARICIMNDKELESYVEHLRATIAPSDSPYAQVPIFPLIPNRDGMMKGKPKKDIPKLEMQRRMEPISSFEDHFFNRKRWLKQEPKSLKDPKASLTLTPEMKQRRRRLTIDNLEEIRKEVKKATDAYRKTIALRERNKSLKLWRRVRGGDIGLETGNPSFYQTFSTYSWSWNVCQELLTPRELREYDNKFYRNSCRSSTPADKQSRADRKQKESKN